VPTRSRVLRRHRHRGIADRHDVEQDRDLVRAGFGEVAQLTDDVLAGRRRVEQAHTEHGSHHP
jgi:hypothetical protein